MPIIKTIKDKAEVVYTDNSKLYIRTETHTIFFGKRQEETSRSLYYEIEICGCLSDLEDQNSITVIQKDRSSWNQDYEEIKGSMYLFISDRGEVNIRWDSWSDYWVNPKPNQEYETIDIWEIPRRVEINE